MAQQQQDIISFPFADTLITTHSNQAMADLILANATQELSHDLVQLGKELISTVRGTLIAILTALMAGVAAYIFNGIKMLGLKVTQVKLHAEGNELKKSPHSSTNASPNASPNASASS